MDPNLFYKLLMALSLGAFIGLEREIHELNESKTVRHQSFLGLRTFTLSMMLGAVAGAVYASVPVLFTLITGIFFLFVLVYYFFDSTFTKDIGITTEIALMYTYILGALITLGILPLQLIVSLTVILTLILSRKKEIGGFVRKIGRTQLGSFISYLVLALVILPLLPDASYTISGFSGISLFFRSFGISLGRLADIELVNPFKLWQIVALITGIDVFGYLLERFVGRKGGWMLASFAGGFVSSTATTQSLAQQSRKSGSVDHLVSSAIVANLASFLQHALIILPLSVTLFAKTIPVIAAMLLSSALLSLYFLRKSPTSSGKTRRADKADARGDALFHLQPALRFALLFTGIKLVSRIALEFYGNSGFLLSIVFGAIPGIDAVLISIAEMSGKALTYQTAVWAFLFANLVNLTTKSVYGFIQGKREFAVKFSVSAAIMMLSGALAVLPTLSR